MKKLMKEFKEFALRGNVVDLAVGVIIGAAFQGIVKSLTDDIISPLIGLFAKTDFSDLKVAVLGVDIRYGAFVTAVINFVIMAFLIFLLVKGMNRLAGLGKKKESVPPPKEKRRCPFCFGELDDRATRCPHCTSQLTGPEPGPETEPGQQADPAV